MTRSGMRRAGEGRLRPGPVHSAHAWHRRALHVLRAPNSLRGEATWKELIHAAVGSGGRALDVGCGPRFYRQDCARVGGFICARHRDLCSTARGGLYYGVPGRLEFRVADAQQPLDEMDLSISSSAGRSSITFSLPGSSWSRAAANNLAPQGRMLWMEPLSHPLALAFHKFVPSAQTRDESPFLPGDLRWIATCSGHSRHPDQILHLSRASRARTASRQPTTRSCEGRMPSTQPGSAIGRPCRLHDRASSPCDLISTRVLRLVLVRRESRCTA